MTRTPRMWDVPPFSWRSAASIFWRAPVYVLAGLLLSILLLAYLQFALPHIIVPASVRAVFPAFAAIVVRTFPFAPAMVVVVGLVFEEPALREDWPAIFRVALMMTGAQLLLYGLQRAENQLATMLFLDWSKSGYPPLLVYAAMFAGFMIFHAALWVRFALLLPMMARGEKFPLRAAWNGMRGHYLAALAVSFIAIVPWYAVQWGIRQYVYTPLAMGVSPPDTFHFVLKADRMLLLLVQGMEVMPLYLLQAAVAAWLWRVIIARAAIAPSP